MPRLVFSTAALRDLADIEARIEDASGSEEIAERFVTQLAGKCKRLAQLETRIGRKRPELLPDLRSYPYRNYIIFFRYVGDKLQVINVLHGARDISSIFEGTKEGE